MPHQLARLRRAAGRLLGGGTGGEDGPAGICTVPVTVRAYTSDGADMRLLLDVRFEDVALSPHDLERLLHALTVPATRSWVRQRDLARLRVDLTTELDDVGASVRAGLAEVGAHVITVDLVAAEHLLVSPSADPVHGSE